MIVCDICNKEIKKGEKYTARADNDVHFHDDCISLCKEIIENSKLSDIKVVYLNEYKELKEQGKI